MKPPISKSAFDAMMQAVKHFEQVDEGCGFDLLDERIASIKETHELNDREIETVYRWACRTYYMENLINKQ